MDLTNTAVVVGGALTWEYAVSHLVLFARRNDEFAFPHVVSWSAVQCQVYPASAGRGAPLQKPYALLAGYEVSQVPDVTGERLVGCVCVARVDTSLRALPAVANDYWGKSFMRCIRTIKDYSFGAHQQYPWGPGFHSQRSHAGGHSAGRFGWAMRWRLWSEPNDDTS